MAFPSAAGYTNLPNGNFSPVIYSKKAQKAFRKNSVCQAITCSDYFGEISAYGDSVRIIKEPEITVRELNRGTKITTQDLDDEDFTLIVDKAFYYAFAMDDIEKAHSHVDFMQMASDRAGYRLADNFDQDILGYLTGFKQSSINSVADTARAAADMPGTKAVSTAGDDELLTSMKLRKDSFGNITTSMAGDHSIPLATRLPGATAESTSTATPLQVLNRMARLLDQQNVTRNGRWLVIDPVFKEMLLSEDSRLVNSDYGGSKELSNGKLWENLYNFRVYESNNLPSVGTGPDTSGSSNQNTDYGVIVAGHDNAVATAEQIRKTERYRSTDTFGEVVRGMHLYGRKILRPESLVTAKYNRA